MAHAIDLTTHRRVPVAGPTGAFRFVELQRRRWGWIASLLTAVLGLSYLWRGATAASLPDAIADFVLWLWIGVGLPLNLWRPSLRTTVHGDILELRYSPFSVFQVSVHRIRDVQVTNYYPSIDHGFGVRRGQALRIYLDGGDFVLVGTQHPDDLRRVLGHPPVDTVAQPVDLARKGVAAS